MSAAETISAKQVPAVVKAIIHVYLVPGIMIILMTTAGPLLQAVLLVELTVVVPLIMTVLHLQRAVLHPELYAVMDNAQMPVHPLQVDLPAEHVPIHFLSVMAAVLLAKSVLVVVCLCLMMGQSAYVSAGQLPLPVADLHPVDLLPVIVLLFARVLVLRPAVLAALTILISARVVSILSLVLHVNSHRVFLFQDVFFSTHSIQVLVHATQLFQKHVQIHYFLGVMVVVLLVKNVLLILLMLLMKWADATAECQLPVLQVVLHPVDLPVADHLPVVQAVARKHH